MAILLSENIAPTEGIGKLHFERPSSPIYALCFHFSNLILLEFPLQAALFPPRLAEENPWVASEDSLLAPDAA